MDHKCETSGMDVEFCKGNKETICFSCLVVVFLENWMILSFPIFYLEIIAFQIEA